ncbi:hypothetical protein A0J61_10985 [Choanephora cucurbitarum]|uniref:Uncharacterized protein n=1 Tax=Choanephora cucurbitarum TaxID=101091 RepID=A0A1C7MWY1_9FUNG|nr:hypothetical protein A0J61_10985 [Choanephora cucurbitarum]
MFTHSIQNLLQVIERSRAVVKDVQLEIEDEDLLDRLNGNQHHYGLHDNQSIDLETCLLLFRFTLDRIKQSRLPLVLLTKLYLEVMMLVIASNAILSFRSLFLLGDYLIL